LPTIRRNGAAARNDSEEDLHARRIRRRQDELVSRFVHSIFSDKYLTTLGVKIEKKSIDLGTSRST
jgi:hypothetical protein